MRNFIFIVIILFFSCKNDKIYPDLVTPDTLFPEITFDTSKRFVQTYGVVPPETPSFNGLGWPINPNWYLTFSSGIQKANINCSVYRGTFSYKTYNQLQEDREVLYFSGLYLNKTGTFQLSKNGHSGCQKVPTCSLVLLGEDGDAIAGTYELSESKLSVVTISDYNIATGDFTASFNVNLVKIRLTDGYFVGYPDEVHFICPSFKGKWIVK